MKLRLPLTSWYSESRESCFDFSLERPFNGLGDSSWPWLVRQNRTTSRHLVLSRRELSRTNNERGCQLDLKEGEGTTSGRSSRLQNWPPKWCAKGLLTGPNHSTSRSYQRDQPRMQYSSPTNFSLPNQYSGCSHVMFFLDKTRSSICARGQKTPKPQSTCLKSLSSTPSRRKE